MAEDLILVQDLDGDCFAGLGIAGELDLSKAALAKGLAELVLAHAGAIPGQSDAHFRSHGYAVRKAQLKERYRERQLWQEKDNRNYGLTEAEIFVETTEMNGGAVAA